MTTLREWVLARSFNELQDIVNHGCASCCVGGIIYYHETTAVHDLHEQEIWEELEVEADNCGYDTPLEMISSFNNSKDISSMQCLKNILVWWYVEHIAYEFVGEKENEDDNS